MANRIKGNRIVVRIAENKIAIEKVKADNIITAEQAEETRKALDFNWEEYTALQRLKSEACLNNRLSTDEGMTVYNYLGEGGPDKFNEQPLEVKVVLTQLLAELLKSKVA